MIHVHQPLLTHCKRLHLRQRPGKGDAGQGSMGGREQGCWEEDKEVLSLGSLGIHVNS